MESEHIAKPSVRPPQGVILRDLDPLAAGLLSCLDGLGKLNIPQQACLAVRLCERDEAALLRGDPFWRNRSIAKGLGEDYHLFRRRKIKGYFGNPG
jgi:hypothetical protein